MAKEKVKLTTPVFRVGFPNLFEPTSYKDNPKKTYNLIAIFTPAKYTGKDKERWNALKALIDAECKRVFKKTWAECCKSEEEGGIDNFKRGLRNGKNKKQEGFGEGTWFATLATKFLPGVVGPTQADGSKPVISVEEGNTDEIYAGIYGRASVGVYAYDNISKGVAIGLRNFQKLKDGARLDNRGDVGDDFDEEADSEFLNEMDEPSVDKDDDIPF